MQKFLATLTFVILSTAAFAQKGTIRGTVIEDATGEPLFSVTVLIAGTTTGTITDFDGKFSLHVEPGTYDVQISFVSFRTITISDVQVKSGDAVVIEPIRMQEAVEELEAVVVTADVVKSTEAGLLTVKKKSPNMMDGISSANFQKIGDSNAAGAVKRVTGVSVEGGKYVYVRGLGDRYTKTTLNNTDIPGLDPDRNSLQIDIFPTSLLNNMIILKTATADLPADFTGGLVNIETKDFPDEKIMNVSVGMSYNPSMHFKSNALTYKGSSTDWLGFDSDLRELPSAVDEQDLPEPLIDSDQELYKTSKLYSQTLAASRANNFMNYSVGLSLGNQYNLSNGNSVGYIFSGTYKRDNDFYQDVFFGNYQKTNAPDDYSLGIATTRSGAYATENVLLGGLAGIAYKTNRSKFGLSVLRLQNGEKLASSLDAISDDQTDSFEPRLTSNYVAYVNTLEYSQRDLTNVLLHGEHHLGDNTWTVEWKLSPTFSNMTDPDIRRSAFSIKGSEYKINPGEAGSPTRSWRFLDEQNYVGKIDVTKEGQLFGKDAKLKFGSSYVYKERDYSIQTFLINSISGGTTWSADASLNDIVADENLLGNPDGDGGNEVYYQRYGSSYPNSNAYQSDNSNLAAYVSGDIAVTEKLKAILGVRMEMFQQHHSGMNQTAASYIYTGYKYQGRTIEQSKQNILNGQVSGASLLDDEKVLSATDFFPSVNTIYSLTEEQNLRFSYSKTIARPSFKELSYAQILDPVSNRTFNGGLFPYYKEGSSTELIWDGNLHETRINNFDIRWELFMKRGELISLSAFYKTFDAPIELVRVTTSQSGNEFQPRNVGAGQVMGAEFEFRKALDFISPTLNDLSIYGNVTLANSQVKMNEANYESRKTYEKDGENMKRTRAMAGQAPYVVNFGMQYNNPAQALDAGLFYNVKGKTLTVVGEGFFPDIYSQLFHSLNFNMNKSFGEENRATVNLSIKNILNDKNEQFFHAYKGQDQLFEQKTPGMEIGLGLKYAF